MFIADPTFNAVATQVTLSGIAVALLQWFKKSSWFPWLTKESAKLNRIVAAVIAALNAIGVHLAWSSGSVAGSYSILVSGLTLTGVATGIWVWLKMFVFQQIIYHSTVKDAAATNQDAKPSTAAAPYSQTPQKQ